VHAGKGYCFHSFICFPFPLHPFQDGRGLEPIPGAFGQQRDKQPCRLPLTSMVNLESTDNLSCMFLNGTGREPMLAQGEHANHSQDSDQEPGTCCKAVNDQPAIHIV